MDKKIQSEIRGLRDKCGVAYVGSVRGDGFPQVKAMLVAEHGDLRVHYFSTNLSSKRAALFTGTIEVCTDHDTKAFLWHNGDEMYYPNGVDDEDYCVYKFTAETVNYYHGLSNETFPIEELSEQA